MRTLVTIASLMAATAFLATAQMHGAGKWMQMYDPAAETTLKGTIEDVKQGTGTPMMMGTHLVVKTAAETREVMLGPTSFIESKGFSFAKGDTVEVTGSRVAMGGTDYIIAREVVKDGKTLTLRDRDGRPQWAIMRMRRGATAK